MTLLVLLLAEFSVASAEDAATDAVGVEYFEKQVRPLLVARCFACHAGEEHDGGLRLDSRAAWQAGGDSGPAITPGHPEQSRLIVAVRYGNRDLQMPPKERLPDSEIAILERWIAIGAPDPRAEPIAASHGPKGMSIAEGRDFWSLKPVANPPVPACDNSQWISTPVDSFILAELEAQQLAPAPPADRRTLIRRVTFDLIGLPPTPAEIDNFLNDTSSDAYRHVVDRLLGSPQYGERWGRHWLDVVRYADSNGLDENLAYGNAWRYRDYVIDSFNRDKPIDQFIIEQIAGDLLPHADVESKIATGFLALGAKVLAEPDREKLVMDTIDEQIDTLGKTFLGMTFGCARCHDHKFDPVTQRDYYGLAAIFKSTQTFGVTNTGAIKHWYEHSFADPGQRSELAHVEARIAEKAKQAAEFKAQAMEAIRKRAVENAASYLAAATQFSESDPFERVQALAEQYGLHPRMLHHCRLHLAYSAEDPLVAKWREITALDSTSSGVQKFFAALFKAAASTTTEAKAGKSQQPEPNSTDAAQDGTDSTSRGTDTALTSKVNAANFDPDLLAHVAKALADKSGLISVPPQPEHAFDEATLAQYYALMEEARLLESAAPDEAAAMGVADGTVFVNLPIHIRGSHQNLGEPIGRELPEVMRLSDIRPIWPRHQSGRLELANWIASGQHPLTARVYVNRVWRWHFGRGLVGSPENFGTLGDRPTHPALLDWLARFFIENGWSTKELHRVMVLSSTYQMASHNANDGVARAIDPENYLLWKAPIQRLEAEQIRDSILAVSGRLDTSMGGKTVPLRNRQFVFNHTSVDHTKYDSLRRAVYLPVIRNNLYTFFEQFDFPDPTMPTGNRSSTVVAPQALLMMNDSLILDAAQTLADRVQQASSHPLERAQIVYHIVLGRNPTQHEVSRALAFVDGMANSTEDVGVSPWALLGQTLMASNEFITVR